MPRGRHAVAGIAIIVAFALSPALISRIDPGDYVSGRSRDVEARMKRNASAAAIILGELRTSFSDMMFIKTERYLHSGIAYVPHMDRALLSLEGEQSEAEHHQEEVGEEDHHADHDHLHHKDIETVVPSPSLDFRGFIGDLERQVKPWRDPSKAHIHTDGMELLPWFRMMTLSDPRYIRGYAVGGWWLQNRNLEQAFAFVKEGVENNPESFEIYMTLGQLYLNQARRAEDEENRRSSFAEALDAYIKSAQFALEQRPPDWTGEIDDPRWSDYQENDLLASMRLSVFLEERHGDPQSAYRRATTYLQQIGQDTVLEEWVARHGEEVGGSLPEDLP
jgi:tetratricopeptide (TPR) repeat protein